jgi:hypothetical protein
MARRRADYPIWAALSAAFVAPVFALPLILESLQSSDDFWAIPRLGRLIDAYGGLFQPALLPTVVALLPIAALQRLVLSLNTTAAGDELPRAQPPMHEVVAAVTLMGLPVLLYVIAILVTNAFTTRYAVATVAGFAILVPYVLYASGHFGVVAAAVLSAVCFALLVARLGLGVQEFLEEGPQLPFGLLYEQTGGAPVAITSPEVFLQAVHYAPERSRPTLYYAADIPDSKRLLGYDTVERTLMELAKIAPLNVQHYDAFVARNARFRVYHTTPGSAWLVKKLLEDGARVELVAERPNEWLYTVSFTRD